MYYFVFILTIPIFVTCKSYTKDDLLGLREEVRDMFNHAYNGYLTYAYPYDELRPLTCDGVDTWGSYSLTLIDALDTLAVMGNYTEFKRVINLLSNINFDIDINVSVFETNIRIIGGLLSAHMLSHKAGVSLEPAWPCDGPLLSLAENVAKKLLPAFDTPTGMPYGTVNLKYGVPPGETSITCTAGIGTYILEFGTLSKLTGNPVYERIAMRALYALFKHRSEIGLVGNHIDVLTGTWTALDSGIGAGVDSYFEYLVKGAIFFEKPELMLMFNKLRNSIDSYLKHGNWYFWANMHKGTITLPVFQSLEAYWPGVLSLIGHMNDSINAIRNYHKVWKLYGFTPEFYNVYHQQNSINRESYPLRPELAESAMYLFRATGNPYFIHIGLDILKSIQYSAITPCGYATIKDCRYHTQENRMESFFLAETTKYLYLLFDPDNFIHNPGKHGTVFETSSGNTCIINSGGYIFNTEAHPLDPGMLHCCTRKIPLYPTPSKDKKLEILLQFENSFEDFDKFMDYFDAYLDEGTPDTLEKYQKENISVDEEKIEAIKQLRESNKMFMDELYLLKKFVDQNEMKDIKMAKTKLTNSTVKKNEQSDTKCVDKLIKTSVCTLSFRIKQLFFNLQTCTVNHFCDEEIYGNNQLIKFENKKMVKNKFDILHCSRQPFGQRFF